MSTLFRHIHIGRMVDLLEGRLPTAEREQLEAHLASCTKCTRELAKLGHLIELMRTDKGENAPLHVINRAVQLGNSPSMPASVAPDLRRRIMAALRFDSQGLAPAFGVRSGEPGARQLLFNTEEHAIDLRIQPEGEAWVIAGQVFGESISNARAELQGAASGRQATLNFQSEFILPSVPAGRYKLTLHLADVDIELDELNVGM